MPYNKAVLKAGDFSSSVYLQGPPPKYFAVMKPRPELKVSEAKSIAEGHVAIWRFMLVGFRPDLHHATYELMEEN